MFRINCVFFPKNYFYPPLPRKHWAAIGYKGIDQIDQPIGATVHSKCVESFDNLLQRYVGKGWDLVRR